MFFLLFIVNERWDGYNEQANGRVPLWVQKYEEITMWVQPLQNIVIQWSCLLWSPGCRRAELFCIYAWEANQFVFPSVSFKCVLVFWKVQRGEPLKHECGGNVVEGNSQRYGRIWFKFKLLLFLLGLLAAGVVHYLYLAYTVATTQKKHKVIRLLGCFVRICTQIFFTALCGTQSTSKGRVDSHDAR